MGKQARNNAKYVIEFNAIGTAEIIKGNL